MIDPVAILHSSDAVRGLRSNSSGPGKLSEVAAEFESLLLTQILKSMRESSSGGWLGEEECQGNLVMVEFAEQQFARAMASQGGLGLADLVKSGLSRESE
jgi:Rod binding domain-containing protein